VNGLPPEAPAPRDRGRTARGRLPHGLGFVWLANVAFVVDPANDFFSSFAAVAGSFGGSTLGGSGFASTVAAHPLVFSVLIAGATIALAVCLLGDVWVRAACVVGAVFNLALLVTQWGQTVVVPGGTDVGPHPVYLVGYLALFVGYQPGVLSVAAAVRRALARKRPVGDAVGTAGPSA
jgi:hypothetical protein